MIEHNKHGTDILLVLSGIGLITATIFSSLSAIKAVQVLEEHEQKGEKLEVKDKIFIAFPYYIPTIVACGSTLVCLYSAGMRNRKMQMAIASLYSLSSSALSKYRDKTVELYGDEADKKITESIIFDSRSIIEAELSTKGELSTLFYEPITDSYFYTDLETVVKAEFELNRTMLLLGESSVNDFLGYLGLHSKDYCTDLGWKDGRRFKWIDVKRKKRIWGNEPCFELLYSVNPEYGYNLKSII